MAERAFMGGGPPFRQHGDDVVAGQEQSSAFELVHIGWGNADIDDADDSRPIDSRPDVEAEFREAEGDGERGADRLP